MAESNPVWCPHAVSETTPCCLRDGRPALAKITGLEGSLEVCSGCDELVVDLLRTGAIGHARMCALFAGLKRAAQSAYHLAESLLAVREGPADELIAEVRDNLKSALDGAAGERIPREPAGGEPLNRYPFGRSRADMESTLLNFCHVQQDYLEYLMRQLAQYDPNFRFWKSPGWDAIVRGKAAMEKADALINEKAAAEKAKGAR